MGWESDDKSSWRGHVATVTGVKRDDDGNVQSIDIIQGHLGENRPALLMPKE
ncbi:MAG: hypothetical protein PQJ46_03370 [Spirochaetales bacterium]|nr:hypothetical protein [Spirochaetales bacterium]